MLNFPIIPEGKCHWQSHTTYWAGKPIRVLDIQDARIWDSRWPAWKRACGVLLLMLLADRGEVGDG